MTSRASLLLLCGALLPACGAAPSDATSGAGGNDLPLGDVEGGDTKADQWGAALKCKAIPNLPSLVQPRITISIDGLTLHLVDPATGYDKVFPVGPGRIDTDATSATYGESLSDDPLINNPSGDFSIEPANADPCKTWWTDPDTGAKSPVFAGLPFMSWSGNYAIHGPIDNFTAPNGGSLRRGFVSHGCVRMQAADILEVYARLKSVAHVPVHVQREPERAANGRRVDVTDRWIGAECAVDGDCDFAGGFCKHNPYSDRGYCSARCTTICADKAGYPMTTCVADPDDKTKGMCVATVQPQNDGCRNFDHFVPATRGHFARPTSTVSVCLPGTRGWIGDHCLATSDCQQGTSCVRAIAGKPGICTEGCSQFCPDETGAPTTTCAPAGTVRGAGTTCVRQCTPSTNASECPADSACTQITSAAGARRWVCVPR